MIERIVGILGGEPSVYLYGSAVLGDYRPGWSDIDILVLTRDPIEEERAERLLYLRQELEKLDPAYRGFEGGMLTLDRLLSGEPDRVVYWGTSGQRTAEHYDLDCFSRLCLLRYGKLLRGEDVRGRIPEPTPEELGDAVAFHLDTIRKYGRLSGRSLYSLGWMLDISRCIYTLRTGDIISKTAAGEWALEKGLCPEPEALEFVLKVRKKPMEFKDDPAVLDRAENIFPAVLDYADELERELKEYKNVHKHSCE